MRINKKKSGLAPIFAESRNWPLRGLFWLSKDLFEKNPEFREAIAPDAQQVNEIRNYLEHKYVTLHDSLVGSSRNGIQSHEGVLSIEIEDFYRKSMTLLKLSRSALLYLSMAIHAEEKQKNVSAKNKFSAPMFRVYINNGGSQDFCYTWLTTTKITKGTPNAPISARTYHWFA